MVFDTNVFWENAIVLEDYHRPHEQYQPHPSGRPVRNERGEVNYLGRGKLVALPRALLTAAQWFSKTLESDMRIETRLLEEHIDTRTGRTHETWAHVALCWDAATQRPKDGSDMHAFCAVMKVLVLCGECVVRLGAMWCGFNTLGLGGVEKMAAVFCIFVVLIRGEDEDGSEHIGTWTTCPRPAYYSHIHHDPPLQDKYSDINLFPQKPFPNPPKACIG